MRRDGFMRFLTLDGAEAGSQFLDSAASDMAVDADGNGYAVGSALWRISAGATGSIDWTREDISGSAIAVDADDNIFVASGGTLERIPQ